MRILLGMRFYRRQLHEGVAAYCREQHWVLDSYDHSPDLDQANQWNGMILLHQSVPEFEPFLKKNTPVVTLAMDETGKLQPASVVQDQEAIGAMGAAHLLERGFKRLYFCGYDDAISHARFRGMRAEALRHGIKVKEICLPHRSPVSKGVTYIFSWLKEHLLGAQPPFAVLAAHDMLGGTILDACNAAGLKVPEQVAVLGVDNEPLICDCAVVPLSSVDNNLFQHGYEAAKLLRKLMQGERPLQPVRIPPKRVEVRASTDTIATENLQLGKILQHIHAQYGDSDLTINEICERFGISRRRLWEMFGQAKLASPGQIMHEVRLRRACVALMESSQTIQEIALLCGFASVRSFGRYFRKVKGQSPEKWRQAARTSPAEG